jgi:Ca2+-binding EF-hand superfamily protein
MFTKDEREQLKVAFRNTCDESDEIMAHAFEMVYTAAGVQVNSNECPSVLEILSLHPDTKVHTFHQNLQNLR